jgi:hypothetical protein
MIGLASLALAAAAQAPARPPVPAQMSCRMIAANGAVLGFDMATRQRGGGLQVKVTPSTGSTWPTIASDFLVARPGEGIFNDYRVGSGADAKVMQLAPTYPNHSWQHIQLLEARGEGSGLLLAHGYCSEGPSSPLPGPAAAAAAPAAFADPASWPDHCFVLARDGRVSRIRYGVGAREAAFEPMDQGIWPAGRVTVPRLSPVPPPARNGIRTNFATMFAGAGDERPSFFEIAYIDQAARNLVLLLRFDELKGITRAADDSGFAICGWRNVDVEG